MINIAFPYRIDARGRTAEVSRPRHIRDLIELVLFTAPGERVMRPDFGANLLATVFAPVGGEEAAALQALIQGALQEQLREVIEVRGVTVNVGDGLLSVMVAYVIIETRESARETFETEVSP